MSSPKCPYCIHCDAPVDKIDYSAKLETFEVKGGTVITYVEVSAYCRECGTELYVPEINDMNKLSRDNAYTAAMKRDRAKGEWIDRTDKLGNSWYYCSECGHEMFFTGTFDSEQHFCYYCGADMRKEGEIDENAKRI